MTEIVGEVSYGSARGKTKGSIVNAFLSLRAKKPLEKITVKELCQLARINKSTFYTHYPDIFALSYALEGEVVEAILADIPIRRESLTTQRNLPGTCSAPATPVPPLFRPCFPGVGRAAH
mgnify:CR=1 FL=1